MLFVFAVINTEIGNTLYSLASDGRDYRALVMSTLPRMVFVVCFKHDYLMLSKNFF